MTSCKTAASVSVSPDCGRRVTIVSTDVTWGGLGRYTVMLAKGLRAQGWRTTSVLTHGAGARLDDLTEVSDRVVQIAAGNPGERLHRLAKVLRADPPAVVVLNHCAPANYVLPFLKCKPIAVAILHNDIQYFYRIACIASPWISAWVAPTPKLASRLSSLNPSLSSRAFVLPHGVDVAVEPSDKIVAKSKDTELRLVFVGAVYEWKGATLLPSILGHIHNSGIKAHLTIVGEGPMLPAIRDDLASRGLLPFCTIAGRLETTAVLGLMRRSHVLLLPTRVEAFGLVLAEAMACGAVPVVTRLPGITDAVVDDGRTGFLTSREPEEFADVVVSLWKDRDRLAAMGVAGTEVARNRFSLEAMALSYDALLRRLAPMRVPRWKWLPLLAREAGAVLARKFGTGTA